MMRLTMTFRVLSAVALAALVALGAGCHGRSGADEVPDGGPDVPIAGQQAARAAEDSADAEHDEDMEAETDAAPDVIAITNTEGNIVLGLRHDTVYMRLSDSVLAGATKGLDATNASGGVGGWIEKTVKGTVKNALQLRVAYGLDEIEDVHYSGGAIRFEYHDRHAFSFEDFKSDDRRVLEDFSPEDARRFVAAVRAAKHEN
jgi:hypothetical protein